MPFTFNEADWTPQSIRILQIALLECERDGSGQATRAGVGELCVACLMEDNNFLAETFKAYGLSVADLRNGIFYKPPSKQLPA
jgi:hypothetical protein